MGMKFDRRRRCPGSRHRAEQRALGWLMHPQRLHGANQRKNDVDIWERNVPGYFVILRLKRSVRGMRLMGGGHQCRREKNNDGQLYEQNA